MTEPTRNMLGFMLVATLIGAAMVVCRSILLNRRPRVWAALNVLTAMAAFGFVIFWVAGLLELHVAYAFTIPRLRNAKTVKGEPASSTIQIDGARWTTGDYFASKCGNHDNLICVRLETPSNNTDYYFVYDSRTEVIVPMTDAAANAFPSLLPEGDEFVSICKLPETLPGYSGKCVSANMGPEEFKLPTKWFRAAIRRQ